MNQFEHRQLSAHFGSTSVRGGLFGQPYNPYDSKSASNLDFYKHLSHANIAFDKQRNKPVTYNEYNNYKQKTTYLCGNCLYGSKKLCYSNACMAEVGSGIKCASCNIVK